VNSPQIQILPKITIKIPKKWPYYATFMDLLNKRPKNAKNLPLIDSPSSGFHHFSSFFMAPGIPQRSSTSAVGGSHHIEEVGKDGEAHVAGGFQHPVAGQVLRKPWGFFPYAQDLARPEHGGFRGTSPRKMVIFHGFEWDLTHLAGWLKPNLHEGLPQGTVFRKWVQDFLTDRVT